MRVGGFCPPGSPFAPREGYFSERANLRCGELTGKSASCSDLSQRRAQAVIQYLANKANVPAHKIYLIGLGKDHPVAENSSAAGRAKNRRVEVRLMTNREGEGTSAANQQPTAPR